MKMKVWISPKINLNVGLIKKEFEVVKDYENAEYFICWAFIPREIIILNKLDKVLLLQYEPPLTSHRRWTYVNFDKFHTVLTYNPNPNNKNEFPITDNPLYYPRAPGRNFDKIRKDTKLTDRRIYYSGMKVGHFYSNVPDNAGGIILKLVRDKIGERLLKEYPNSTVIGKGWPIDTKQIQGNWRLQKVSDVEECGADFCLCMENCMLDNYVSEKFHDGFSVDRVVLYLGEPSIEKRLPSNCFINLNPLFNKETKEFDFNKMIDIVKNMTQEEYDEIIKNGRAWRATFTEDEWFKRRDETTKFIIDRIKNDK